MIESREHGKEADPARTPVGRSERRHARVAAPSLRATLSADRSRLRLLLVNVSSSGAALLAADRLGEVDDVVPICLCNIDDGAAVELECRVCYVIGQNPHLMLAQPKWLHGVEFRGVSFESSSFLERVTGSTGH